MHAPGNTGNNNISKLSAVGYLRRFERLQLVNLAGNPVARDPGYRWGYGRAATVFNPTQPVLSHLHACIAAETC
jgi:hypothetical protein